jgi:hypothetical protein
MQKEKPTIDQQILKLYLDLGCSSKDIKISYSGNS